MKVETPFSEHPKYIYYGDLFRSLKPNKTTKQKALKSSKRNNITVPTRIIQF